MGHGCRGLEGERGLRHQSGRRRSSSSRLWSISLLQSNGSLSSPTEMRSVGDGGQSLLGEITAAPVLPLVIFRKDGVRFRQAHLPDLGVDARGLLAVAVDELDRLAMDVEDLAQGLRILPANSLVVTATCQVNLG